MRYSSMQVYTLMCAIDILVAPSIRQLVSRKASMSLASEHMPNSSTITILCGVINGLSH